MERLPGRAFLQNQNQSPNGSNGRGHGGVRLQHISERGGNIETFEQERYCQFQYIYTSRLIFSSFGP